MIENKAKIKYLVNLSKKYFNYNSVFIQHYLCPGFENNYKSSFRKEWNELVFYSKHIPATYTKLMIEKNRGKSESIYKQRCKNYILRKKSIRSKCCIF